MTVLTSRFAFWTRHSDIALSALASSRKGIGTVEAGVVPATLANDAERRGWIDEADRHRKLLARLDTLIAQAG